jgi:penicillin-binding protein 1A
MPNVERPSSAAAPPAPAAQVIPLHPRDDGAAADGPGPRPHVRIKKLRVFLLLSGLGLLAAVSTVFGAMMAVASDLPSLEDPPVRNSVLVDINGRRIGMLTGSEQRIFVRSSDIAPVMKHAIIAIEDRRFYTNEGVDIRGIGRALWQDVVQQRVVQGGSTITQQFVKNATAAQGDRTLFNKLREAALAFHLTRKWSKDRILRNYLNTIYFGNGAYGIESAARVYFAWAHPGCGERGRPMCASLLEPHEAALLAAVVASPSGYDPLEHPASARRRRDLVLRNMVDQRYLSLGQFEHARAEPLPTRGDVQPPTEETTQPYFTSWVKQQVVDRLGGGQQGARAAYESGLVVQTTLDLELQEAADAAVAQWLPYPDGPRAAVAVVHNKTGQLRAMVAGDDHATRPFNIVTQGRRQPGSAFKPFILAEALRQGISPDSLWSSTKQELCVRRKGGSCVDVFEVNNYSDAYAGTTTLRNATTFSDNAVYAQVGLEVGTRRVARMARRMGIRTKISTNAAMTLGGLKQGVTPLDMAHAYSTLANDGKLTYGTLSSGADAKKPVPAPAPSAIKEIRRDGEPVELPNGDKARNKTRTRRVVSKEVAEQVEAILSTVVESGTAVRADLGEEFAAGKTGTTENYGDAWFVGWNREYTVAVWVGYPDELRYMESEFGGEPVAGGTYPAAIWRSFMEQAVAIEERRNPDRDEDAADDATATTVAPGTTAPAPETPAAPAAPAPETPVPAAPAPETAVPAAPAPAQPPPAPAPEAPAPAPAVPAPETPTAPPSTESGGAAPPSG